MPVRGGKRMKKINQFSSLLRTYGTFKRVRRGEKLNENRKEV